MFRGRREVISLTAKESDVLDEKERSDNSAADVLILVVREDNQAHRGDGRYDSEKDRKNSSDASFKERKERKAVGFEIAFDDTGDEKAGEDEKDIHTDEAAGEESKFGVIENDGQNRNRSKTIYVSSITHLVKLRFTRA